MKRSFFGACVSFLAIVLVCVLPASAQYTPASVSGTVVDPTEAIIPGATVTLTHIATGVIYEQQTTSAGTFLFDRVRPGNCTLRVSAEGFRTYEATNLQVLSGKVTALGTITLEVGAKGEVVTVEATAVPLVARETAQISGNYDSRKITDTTFGFFGLDAIAFLTPGVLPGIGNINTNGGFGATTIGDQFGTSSSISANGMRARSNNFTIDGQTNNDITVSGPSFFVGNMDVIQEYQITTNQFNADQGRNLGATINVITKSGTNDIHGSVYWFFQNNVLNSTRSPESQGGETKPAAFHYNEGGFTIGGPAIKNKLFFFGGIRIFRQPGSFLDAETTRTLSLTDTGIARLLSVTPASIPYRVYSVSGPLQNPAGNPRCRPGSIELITFATVTGVEACRVERDVPSTDNLEDFNARIDWIGQKNSIYGRYIHQDETFCCTGGDGVDIRSGYFIAVPSRSQILSLTHTYQLSPRSLNEFRFAFSRISVAFEGGSTFPLSQNGLNLPRITMPTSPIRFRSFGLATNIPQGRFVTDFQFQDNWSLVWGKHTFKAGIDIRRDRTVSLFLPNINGAFGFTSQTRLRDNQPTSFAFAAGAFDYAPFETDQFYYFQDDIRLRPNLTLNVGIRYENTGQPIQGIHEETLARENDPTQAFWLQSVPAERRSFPSIARDDNNWGPRIGFSYTPRWGKALFGEDKTVIRGGYGIAYEVAFYNILLNTSTAAPRVFAFSNTCTAANLVLCPGIPAAGTGTSVAGVAALPLNRCDPNRSCDHDLNPATARIAFNWTRVGRKFQAPYAQSWSFGIQREIGRVSVLEVRYVGTKSTKLFYNLDANPRAAFIAQGSAFFGPCPAGGIPTLDSAGGARCLTIAGRPNLIPSGLTICTDSTASGFNGINCGDIAAGRALDRINAGRGIYHSLQSRFDVRNWRNQLTGGVTYTWSHNIDNGTEILGVASLRENTFSQNPFAITGERRGDSGIDIRHAVTVNAIWDLPWRRDQKGLLGKIAGGWEVTGTGYFYTGRPWTPIQTTAGGAASASAGFGGQNPFCSSSPRLDTFCLPHLSNPNAPLGSVGVFLLNASGVLTLFDVESEDPTTAAQVHWIINNAEAMLAGLPPFGAARNLRSTRGDGTQVINLGLFKNTYVGKENRVNIQFRSQFINAFNHRNYGRPDTFNAQLAGSGFADFRANDAPGRVITLGLRVVF